LLRFLSITPARTVLALTPLMLLGSFAAPATAFTIDMEGHAPPGGNTNELAIGPGLGISTQGSFQITVEHGHYWSATHPNAFAQSDIGGTATDWFLHDSPLPLHIEELGGNPFSVTSFQAGEWLGALPPTYTTGVSTTGNPIDVVGFLFGGGTITTTFVSDAISSDGPGPHVDFETFFFGPGWDDLIALEFSVDPPDDANRQFGYDNIVVDVVPEPSTALLVALGLAGIAFPRHSG